MPQISGPDLGYLVGFARSAAYLTDDDLEEAIASHRSIEGALRALYGKQEGKSEVPEKWRTLLKKVDRLAHGL